MESGDGVTNKTFNDGSIYSRKDKDGRTIGFAVSPYSEDFWEHIEKGVVPLVKAFKERLYLPIGSCEGHNPLDRRFVAIATYSRRSARNLEKLISKSGIPHLYFQRYTGKEYFNLNSLIESGEVEGSEEEKDPAEHSNLPELLQRGYKEYHILEVILGQEVNSENGLIQNIKTIFFNIFLRKKYTKKLAYFIQNELPLYDM